jgi:Fic-DOC domain mobile mystery protein B
MSTDPLFEADDAATPLTPEEKLGLIPSYITLRRELNEAEQINVTRAEQWAFSRKRDVLDEAYLRRLHKQMFQDVWTWAGEFRTSERNIGVEPWRIATELRQVLENVRYWIDHQTYSIDESAARFHHKVGVDPLFCKRQRPPWATRNGLVARQSRPTPIHLGSPKSGERRGHPSQLCRGATCSGQPRDPTVADICAVVVGRWRRSSNTRRRFRVSALVKYLETA